MICCRFDGWMMVVMMMMIARIVGSGDDVVDGRCGVED